MIRITASKFKFNPNRITLRKGRPVTLRLISSDQTIGTIGAAGDARTETLRAFTEYEFRKIASAVP